jgi:hypothetical protein
MSRSQTKTRAAKSTYAVFSEADRLTGETIYARTAVQFWQLRDNGTWAGMVADDKGLIDAQNFTKFVRFQTFQRSVYPA